jgi:hypothetical protein
MSEDVLDGSDSELDSQGSLPEDMSDVPDSGDEGLDHEEREVPHASGEDNPTVTAEKSRTLSAGANTSMYLESRENMDFCWKKVIKMLEERRTANRAEVWEPAATGHAGQASVIQTALLRDGRRFPGEAESAKAADGEGPDERHHGTPEDSRWLGRDRQGRGLWFNPSLTDNRDHASASTLPCCCCAHGPAL